MMLGALLLAGKNWLPICGIAFVVILAVTIRSYLRSPLEPRLRFICTLLKLVGAFLLIACLLEPMWSGKRAKPGANILAVIADNSMSMKLRGTGEAASRADQLRSLLNEDRSGWRTALTEHFQPRNYLIDSRLTSTQDFSELDFSGRSSALGNGLASLAERTHGQPLAGVILLTDGVAPDLKDADLSGLPPIYPVVIGSERPPRDLAIAAVSVSQTTFEDTPVTIQAEVTPIGLGEEEIIGRLTPIATGTDTDPPKVDKPILEQTIKVPAKDGGKNVFRFQLRPEKPGVSFYRIEVTTHDRAGEEATLENNQTVVAVDRGAGPYRVLYVSGRPNWEYKYIRRAIESDDQTQLVGLIRIAKREPKFEFRGRAGESSNPLFRGFGNQSKEEIERYDQPVFTRLNTQDEFELRNGFPKAAEDLFKYRAIIIDDVEAEFFTPDQMTMIQRFVSDRGGGLLMLGGAESFAEGKFARTPIGDVLPVYVDQAANPPKEATLRLSLTREGWLQPWIRLRSSEPDERTRLEASPEFNILNHIRATKPAATILASVNDGTTDYPALVTQRFGRGRTAALLVGDLWQMGLGDESRAKDLGQAWRQMIRWLVADVPDRVEVRAEPQPNGQDVRLEVRVRDPNFQPLDNTGVTLSVRPVDAKEPVSLTAEASPTEPGLYVANYVVRKSGGFAVDATVTDENKAPLGKASTGWSSDLEIEEFRSLTPNRALLESVARKTGGELITPDQLESFVKDLPSKRAPITEAWIRPIWHTPWVLILALACLLGEWGLRRWKGLA